jgi:hypothetical protein
MTYICTPKRKFQNYKSQIPMLVMEQDLEFGIWNFGFLKAGVVKLVDIPDLGSGAVRHGGSSPSTRTENREIRNKK